MSKLEKLHKQDHELERQLGETSRRMSRRMHMNDRHWNDRTACVEARKSLSNEIKAEYAGMVQEMNNSRHYGYATKKVVMNYETGKWETIDCLKR